MNTSVSRRNFLIKSTGLMALASGLTTAAQGETAVTCCSGSGGFKLGLASYTTRKLSLEETLEVCQQLELKQLSLKDVFHLPVSDEPIRLLQQCASIKAAGVSLYAGGVHYMLSKEDIDKTFAYAQLTGIGILVSVVPYDLIDYTEAKIKATGTSVAIHNHGPGDDLYPTPESAYEKLKGRDPRFGLCIDVGHTQRSGICPAKDLIRFQDRVLDVHLKDVTEATGAGTTTQIGRGVVDMPAVIKALRTINYTGVASFEYEKNPDNPVPGLAECVGYVRGILETLNGQPNHD